VPHDDWNTDFKAEIKRAEEARISGNEGKARVCARRAAGIAIGEYFSRCHISSATSAIKRLETLQDLPRISPLIGQIAEHLLEHVDQDHKLPASIDLIAETYRLLQALEIEIDNPNPTR
jgi:hypothetical protein